VETVVAGGLWNTVADPAQVESAILNLALNARDAMPGGGRLTVEITNASLDDAYARAVRDVTAGQYVMLAVTDTGQGMPEDVRAHVFEPFFTTKSDGKGTGLGLSMVYGFVKQSNGHVQIYSEVGQGTTVKIYLPRSREAVQKTLLLLDPAPPADTAKTVLVVEDEAAVREAALAMIEEMGYRRLEAGDAASALALVQSGEPVDLVFTDVVMPGPLATREFAQRLKELRPGLPVLFTSGYTDNAIIHQGRLDAGVHLISKPYAKTDLARRIATLLADPTAAP
jgi:CheY-like chemotaxis protein